MLLVEEFRAEKSRYLEFLKDSAKRSRFNIFGKLMDKIKERRAKRKEEKAKRKEEKAKRKEEKVKRKEEKVKRKEEKKKNGKKK